MFGLIDCNNFFVSCERVFNPSLLNRPVIVLSNNDGCVVAMSDEAKSIGIKRGIPYFKIKDIVLKHHIAVFSSNYKLYGDMSSRVMATISALIKDAEIYSIDEAFVKFDFSNDEQLENIGRKIIRVIRRNTGIPVSLGIASTKTLAKIAAHFAKKHSAYNGVCVIDSEEKRIKALAVTGVDNIWGIGRKLTNNLHRIGVYNAIDFCNKPYQSYYGILNAANIKTWFELNNKSCINIDTVNTSRKQLCSSRSFSESINDLNLLINAISIFAESICRKLKEQCCCAISLSVFIYTNAFDHKQAQYYNSSHVKLEEPTSDVITITSVAINALKSIFRENFEYKKAGIIITEVIDENNVQRTLFSSTTKLEKRQSLMNVIQKLNQKPNTVDSVHLASALTKKNLIKQKHLSRQFTTRFDDIIEINCNK